MDRMLNEIYKLRNSRLGALRSEESLTILEVVNTPEGPLITAAPKNRLAIYRRLSNEMTSISPEEQLQNKKKIRQENNKKILRRLIKPTSLAKYNQEQVAKAKNNGGQDNVIELSEFRKKKKD